MVNKKIDDVLDIAEYLAFLRLRLLADFYVPYLAWGLYTLISGILSLFGHFEYWIYLWIPAAFFSSLDPNFKNFKSSLMVWLISGSIFYGLVFFLKFAGFLLGIAICSTLGFGILPKFLGSRRHRKTGGSYLTDSIGITFFVVVFSIIAQLFAYRLWEKPQLFSYHFAIMVGMFFGINAAFTRSRILTFWFLVLILTSAIGGFIGMSWYIPVIVLSLGSISVGIYGYMLNNKVNWEVEK